MCSACRRACVRVFVCTHACEPVTKYNRQRVTKTEKDRDRERESVCVCELSKNHIAKKITIQTATINLSAQPVLRLKHT